MAAQPDSSFDINVLNERIVSMQVDLTEIKLAIQCMTANYDELERLYLVEHERLTGKVEITNRRLDDQSAKIDAEAQRVKVLADQLLQLEKSIQPLIVSNKILVWVGTLLGGSVILLIWMILTGQASVVFP